MVSIVAILSVVAAVAIPIFLLNSKPKKYSSSKKYSINVSSDNNPSGPYRASISPQELVSIPQEDVRTLYDLINKSTQTYGKKDCIGVRPLEKEFEDEKFEVEGGEKKKKIN